MHYLGCLTLLGDDIETLEKEAEVVLQKTNDHWWISSVKERVWASNLNRQLEIIRTRALKVGQDFKKINVIVNTTADLDAINCEFNIYMLDFYKALAFYYKYYTDQKFKTHHTPSHDKVLFLLGKPQKIQRTPLLIEFLQQKLMHKLEYSFSGFPVGSSLFNEVKKEVERAGYKNFDLESFMKTYENFLDVPKKGFTDSEYNGFHYSGFPYDHTLFEKTGATLLSESDISSDQPWSDKIWVTEKTWKVIANNSPFILAAPYGMAEHLRSLGYETWDSYLMHDQDKANSFWHSNTRKTLGMIVENVNFFIKNSICRKEVSELVHKNSKLLDSQAKNDLRTIFENANTFKEFIRLTKFPNYHHSSDTLLKDPVEL